MIRPLDAAVLVVALVTLVVWGFFRARKTRDLAGFLVAGHSMPWPVVAFSVMATQASAVTFMATPGQGYVGGLSFVQFYFGLPIAMVVLCATLVPVFQRLRVNTAYEFLEARFDAKTRTLAAGLFLVQRGLSAGVTLYAPALVLSVILGWDIRWTCALLGALVVVTIVLGGSRAVAQAHALQFTIILGTLALTFALVLRGLPQGMGLPDALVVAGASGRLAAVDTSFDPANRYNLWAGLLGGFFLQLSYFGTDQSQVGRILTARSAREGKLGLLFNGLVKVPMQFFILLLGVLVFVAYRFEPAPVFFNPAEAAKAAAGPHGDAWRAAERDWESARAELAGALRAEHAARHAGDAVAQRDAHARALAADVASSAARARAVGAIQATDPDANTNDTNYIFVRYVLSHLPLGIVGLVLAAIFAAAMNSSMSELNALAATTTVDVVQRLRWASDERSLLAWSRFATLFWVVFAVGFAQFAGRLGSLVEAVNIMGSLFYGTILGIFLTALFVKRAGGHAVFTAALLGEAAVIACWKLTPLSFLWWNLIGCVLTLGLAALFAAFTPRNARTGSFAASP
ncbi:MAG TPA: sodium:solute symporter [Methylomirabilota bacterium]|nr:sodium:solute symporter [Methylomirabilota bacterium]